MEKLLHKKMSEKEAMELAIKEAKRGQGFVLPNPPVGCVILDKNNFFLSSGFYSHYGGLHAEVSALNKVTNKRLLESAQVFVTLEPCAHFGKNPPCVDNLLKYPLASVTYGREDPNPKTKGRGLKKLKQKGIRVKKTAFFQKVIQRLYEAFILNMEQGRAFFALKVASSLDGIMALNHGESQWITDKTSKKFVFDLRACFDAALIGVGTFLEDNPRLNIRKRGFEKYSNKVCILDPRGRSLNFILQSRLAEVRPFDKIFVITNQSISKKDWPFQIIHADFLPNKNEFDLKKLGRQLYLQENIVSLLIEGGEGVFSSFLRQNQAHRLYQFISPCIIGEEYGKSWTESFPTSFLKSKKTLKSMEIQPCGKDFLITGVFRRVDRESA